MTAIKAVGLTKKYKDKIAVDSLDLTVNKGEIYALLGTNGAGKTTTIKMLTTLIRPDGGNAFVEGFDIIEQRRQIREIINVSPQETAIAPNLTVYENLKFMAGVYGIERWRERVDELSESFSLDEVLGVKCRTLSGGWQRRLSIAISLINKPHVLFLDEPTLGLDVLARRELWRVIKALRKDMTIILTTHYMGEAEKLADRVGIMSGGRLVAQGSVAELRALAGKDSFEDAFAYLVTGGKL